MKLAVDAIRDAGYNFTKTERCEKRYNPKWGHTEACKNWIMNAFDRKENDNFDDICTDVANKAIEGGKKAGWSGKFTFLCQIVPIEEFEFKDSFKKWWYYEFDLNGKYFFIFMKIDHDR